MYIRLKVETEKKVFQNDQSISIILVAIVSFVIVQSLAALLFALYTLYVTHFALSVNIGPFLGGYTETSQRKLFELKENLFELLAHCFRDNIFSSNLLI